MARPLRNGLLYFPLDVDFFQDVKIRILKGRYGTDGIGVYLYLLCEIYKKGYYTILNEDLILCVANDLGLSEDKTRQIISFLLSRSLLCEIKESKLARPDTVITAVSVQRRYQEAMKGLKRDVAVEAEYWLLKSDETLSFIKMHPQNSKSLKNDSKSTRNSSKSVKNSLKERKGKEKKLNDTERQERAQDFSKVILTNEEREELVRLSDCLTVERYIHNLSGWQQENGKVSKNAYGTIKRFIEEDRAKIKEKPPKNESPSYDIEKWEEFALNYDPGYRNKGGSKD